MATATAVRDTDTTFRAGQLVQVRSADEIMATLDETGELESSSFMPEMLQYCGRQFTVGKVANKLCETIGRSGIRKMTTWQSRSGIVVCMVGSWRIFPAQNPARVRSSSHAVE